MEDKIELNNFCLNRFTFPVLKNELNEMKKKNLSLPKLTGVHIHKNAIHVYVCIEFVLLNSSLKDNYLLLHI